MLTETKNYEKINFDSSIILPFYAECGFNMI